MQTETFITGKDASLESSIAAMTGKLAALGFHVEERTWLNPVEGIWSVHISERDCPLMFTNARAQPSWRRWRARWASFERLSCNYFWTHYYLGEAIANRDFTHYPREQWFKPSDDAWRRIAHA